MPLSPQVSAPATVALGPVVVHITGVRAGDRNEMTVTITGSDGVPRDLTGLTLTAQARAAANDPDPAAIVADVTISDPAAGRVTVLWPGGQVADALGGEATWDGVWDLQLSDGTGDPVTVCGGTFGAVMDVTRP